MDNKINFNTLGLPSAAETQIAINGTTITVKDRIPYEDLFKAIEWCINRIIDDRSFISAPIKNVIADFALARWYTNLDCDFIETAITEEDIYENYDILKGSGAADAIRAAICVEQLAFFEKTLAETLDSIVAYRNSAKGIVDVLSQNAADQSQTMENALSYINDPEKAENIQKLLNFYSMDNK